MYKQFTENAGTAGKVPGMQFKSGLRNKCHWRTFLVVYIIYNVYITIFETVGAGFGICVDVIVGFLKFI
jgi:hypothetical protein